MNTKIKIALAQINAQVGDLEGNSKKMIDYATRARDEFKADIIVFPELSLTAYSPEDILLRESFMKDCEDALDALVKSIHGIYALVSHPHMEHGKRYNAASMIHDGKILVTYHKQHLPNYSVFDEKRYFVEDNKPCVITIKDIPMAIAICEDIWYTDPYKQAKDGGAKMILSPNGSPFAVNIESRRLSTFRKGLEAGPMPLVYVNRIGGQDDLLFDGGSMVLDAQGQVRVHAGFFEEQLVCVDFDFSETPVKIQSSFVPELPKNDEEKVYKGLVLALRDYITKNNIPGVLLGLSGGIDSALVLSLAVDAIGADKVEAIALPSRYTSKLSFDILHELVKNFGVKHREISIDAQVDSFVATLKDHLHSQTGTTLQNIQARCRMIMLMALSNDTGKMVLNTGNKSEMAVGYTTLYGDLAGGFAVLKDVPKTMVYRLAKYRNTIAPVIPQSVIDRPPTAELAPGQTDQDTLPPYEILDQIIDRYVKETQGEAEIIAAGFAPEVVRKVISMIQRNEYKRRQAPPGVRISRQAFGRDRRFPITQRYIH